MDVVIDEVIAVLEVLSFGNTIRGDEQINLTILRHGWHLVALLGTRRKVGEDLIEFRFAKRGAVVSTAGNEGNVDAQIFVGPRTQRFEQVGGSVRERSEHEHLPVRLVELVGGGVFDFAFNELLQLFEFCVPFRGDRFSGGMKQTQLLFVPLQVFEPLVQVEVFQPILEFAANFHGVIGFVLRLGVFNVQLQLLGLGVLVGGGLIIPNLALQVLDLADGAAHGDLK